MMSGGNPPQDLVTGTFSSQGELNFEAMIKVNVCKAYYPLLCDLYDGTGLTKQFWQVQVVLGYGCELWSPT